MNFHDHFSSASDAYRQYRPQYPPELFDYLARLAPSTSHAWDCGCGNGQASIALAKCFSRVTATDASAEQIQQAMPASNVASTNLEYRVSRAEDIEAEDSSLDLISVAQAIHWFDHEIFFREVERTLKPGGVLAAWGYQLLYTDTQLDEVIAEFHGEKIGVYWPAERALLDNGYERIVFPFERQNTPRFFMRTRWTFDHLLGYLNTWSAVKRYQQERGSNPVQEFLPQLRAAWFVGENEGGQEKDIYWPLILYVGKKPL